MFLKTKKKKSIDFFCKFDYDAELSLKDLSNLYHTILTVNTMDKKPFENIEGKGENGGNQHFLLFPQCFLPFQKQISFFQLYLFCCLQMLSFWNSRKFCHLVKN